MKFRLAFGFCREYRTSNCCDHFEKQGLALRIQRLTVETGRIMLFAVADITQFPTL